MGILALLVGVAVLAFGLFQHLKGKRILAAPFKKTGELAKNPTSTDPKGAMSTEGKVLAPAQQLLSPCSKKPCLAYEVKIERLWEKVETTQEGTKTVKGSDTLDTLKGGAIFGVDDGSGAIQIDVTKGGDFDNFKEGFKKELNGRGWASHIQFGELAYDVPVISDSEKYTIGFKATEKLVPVEGSLFVLGKIEGGKIVKPGWRSLMLSSKGRDGLLGSIKKKKKFSFIGGGIAAVASIPLMIFGPSIDTSSKDPNHAFGGLCASTLTGAVAKCSETVSTAEGESFAWTVTRKDTYDLTATPAAGKKVQLDANLIVERDGEVLLDESSDIGQPVKASIELEPGLYTVRVKDVGGYVVKGGFSFDLEIAEQNPEPVAKPAALVANAEQPVAEEQVEEQPKSRTEKAKEAFLALRAKKFGVAEPVAAPAVEALEPVAEPELAVAEQPVEAAPIVEEKPVAKLEEKIVAKAEEKAVEKRTIEMPEVDLTAAAPVAQPAVEELEISAKNLTKFALEMNETCRETFCAGPFNYMFTNLTCDKTARWCQLELTGMNKRSHTAYNATLPITPAAKTRVAFEEVIAEAIKAFEQAPKSGTLSPVVMTAKKPAKKVVVVAEPLVAKKSQPIPTRTVAVAAKPVEKPAPVVVEKPVKVAAPIAAPIAAPAPAPAPAAAPAMRANKNMAD